MEPEPLLRPSGSPPPLFTSAPYNRSSLDMEVTADITVPTHGQFEFQINAREFLTSATFVHRIRHDLPDHFSVFQQVELVAFRAVIDVGTQTTGQVFAAIVPNVVEGSVFDPVVNGSPALMGASAESAIAYLSPQVPVHLELSLPRSHVYGRELKGSVLGPHTPVLVIRIEGVPTSATGELGSVSWSVVVLCRGTSPAFRVALA